MLLLIFYLNYYNNITKIDLVKILNHHHQFYVTRKFNQKIKYNLFEVTLLTYNF